MGMAASEGGQPWPGWARGLASALIGFHLLAMLAVAMAGNPASGLQRDLVRPFARYVELIDQGRVHRYYAPAPPPTPMPEPMPMPVAEAAPPMKRLTRLEQLRLDREKAKQAGAAPAPAEGAAPAPSGGGQ